MNNLEVVSKAEPLLESALAPRGIEIVDIEFKKENGRLIFRVFIDHEDGVDHDRCQEASGIIGDVLDRYDLISQSYYLEVSSPGLDRVLKKDRDFERFAGREVKLKTHEPVNGQKNFKGILKGLEDGHIVLDIEGKNVSIARNNAKQVRLVVEW